jgi:uncharacterized protein (TIGR01777 family)
VTLRLGKRPFTVEWVAEHTRVEPGRGFVDEQIRGPFRSWRHRHEFEPDGEGGCFLRDDIDFVIRGGRAGALLAGAAVKRSLERTFAYRHQVTAADLEFHARYETGRALRVGITGAGGLVGSVLGAMLTTGGHEVVRLVRSTTVPEATGEARWSPEAGIEDLERVEGLDAIVHLAGENIGRRRWSEAQKRRILESRVRGTQALVGALGRLERPPDVFLSASGIGFYGDGGDEILLETDGPGDGFLAEVCRRWESAAGGAAEWANRVVLARLGIVLSPGGGALAKMLPPFRVGLGGKLGNGRQYMSWISIDDAAGALIHLLRTSGVAGPVNLVAPFPVRNERFVEALSEILRRPARLRMPAAVARVAFGRMAEEVLLAGARVSAQRLSASGYRFRQPDLPSALRYLLGRL